MNRLSKLSDHSPVLAVVSLFAFPLFFLGALTGYIRPDIQPVRHLIAGSSVPLAKVKNKGKRGILHRSVLNGTKTTNIMLLCSAELRRKKRNLLNQDSQLYSAQSRTCKKMQQSETEG